MNQYLLTLFDRQPRRIRVIENILKNRRSEATLFWAYNYRILGALGAQRQLNRQDYETQLDQWVREGLLVVDDLQAALTDFGQAQVQEFWQTHYQPHFTQWAWVTNHQTLSNRVLLALQVISHFRHHENHYLSLSLSEFEMNRVRQWVRSLKANDVSVIIDQVQAIIAELAQVDQRLALLLTYRLIGYQTSGWTDDQAAQQLGVDLDEIPVMWRDIWLKVAIDLATLKGPLSSLVQDLISPSPASQSAMKTIQSLSNGLSIEQVSQRRRLKIGTVREHVLEIAILLPELISLPALISESRLQQLQNLYLYQGPAFSWEYQEVASDEARAFFEFRLYQIMRCHQDYGDFISTV